MRRERPNENSVVKKFGGSFESFLQMDMCACVYDGGIRHARQKVKVP